MGLRDPGLLVLLNSENELAGVIGHEMAHVLERHAARRASAATPFAVIFGVPAAILGSVSPTLGGIVGGHGPARVECGPGLVQSRSGASRPISAASCWPRAPAMSLAALATFLRTLEREEELAGQDPDRRSFFATHPATPERVGSVETAARSRDPRAGDTDRGRPIGVRGPARGSRGW